MQQQLRDLLATFNQDSDPVRVRDVLLQYFPDFMTAYGDTAAILGADFYDQLRELPPSAGSVASVFAQPAKTAQSEGSVRWATGFLFGDDPSFDAFTSALLGASQRLVMQPARETIDLLARNDARSGKVAAVRWSRQLSGADNCDFCRMLAGRGVVYRSAQAAGAVIGRGSDRSGFDEDGNRLVGGIGGGVKARGTKRLAASYHDNCDCVAVPTFYERQTRVFNVRGYDRTETVLAPIGS